jgi:hypothetical protein
MKQKSKSLAHIGAKPRLARLAASAIILAVGIGALTRLAERPAHAQTGSRVTFSVNPAVFAQGTPSSTALSVSCVSLTPLTLSPGDTFTFLVDQSVGTVNSITIPVNVASATLSSGDFSAFLGPPLGRITIIYNGQAKPFSYGDSVMILAQITGNAIQGPGKVSLSCRFISTVNGNLPFATVDVVGLTSSGVTDVAHDGTLTGGGIAGSPLEVAVPLNLTGNLVSPGASGVLSVTNTASSGNGIFVTSNGNGLVAESTGGVAVFALGKSTAFGLVGSGGDGVGNMAGGDGVAAIGGNSSSSMNAGGTGLEAHGGIGMTNAGGDGVFALGGDGSPRGNAGNFQGDVNITGNLMVSGMKMFHLDHPLDPENKYLNHAAVESSEVLDIYSGNVTTDGNGNAVVKLPAWFQALNRDFRYQLTVIGAFAQAMVASEIDGNRFTIRTDAPNVKVSWQVTGVRSDASARKSALTVEEDKPERERGYYLNPDAYGQPEERGIEWALHPATMQRLKERREQARIKALQANHHQ